MAIQQGKTDNWVKSSYSGGNGACVEVKAPTLTAVAVRDSKNPTGPAIGFEPSAWTAFVGAVDSGVLVRD
ncbi:DUF397 domain-containing protein [Streptomyces durbertensis]|uniref:DUF397 domain-containing protein n=1 Tax=Streptomyces durbertensis TaxID=2448886 RepID=A0ABR6EDQ8_9ACTN|nr:DUF397 domain-containing protein [Streptomyces durbertensis]MBB1243469.1 DUF397 domain-containing protein [Streptomyces durbertensis]